MAFLEQRKPADHKARLTANPSSEGGRHPAASSSEASTFPKISHADYAWALGRLRRAGINPTLEAIYREIENRGNHPTQQASTPGRVPDEPVETGRRRFQSETQAGAVGSPERSARQAGRPWTPYARDSREFEGYREAVDSLEKQVAHYRTLIEEARQKEVALRGQLDVLSTELASAKSQELELAKWKALCEDATAKAEAFENQVEEMRVEAVLAESLESLIQEQKLSLEATGQRVEALTAHLREASAKASLVEGLQSQLVALDAEIAALREREATYLARLNEEQATRTELEQRLQARTASGQPLDIEQFKELAEAKRLLELDLLNLRRGEAALERRLEETRNQAERSTARLHKEIQDLRARNSDTASEIIRIATDRDHAIEARQRLVEELEQHARERQQMHERLLAAQQAAAQEAEARQQLEARLEQARAELQTLCQREATLQAELEAARSNSHAADELAHELANLRERASGLEHQLGQANQQAGLVPDLQAGLDRSRAELQALRQREATLQAELEAARKNSHAADELARELADLRERAAGLEHQLQEQLDQAGQQAALLDLLRAELVEERGTASALRAREKSLLEQIQQLQTDSTERDLLRRELDERQATIAGLQERETDLQQQLELFRASSAATEALRDEVRSLEELAAGLRTERDEVALRLEQAGDTAQESSKLRKYAAQLEEQIARLEQTCAQQRSKVEEADGQAALLANLENELDEHRVALADARNQNDRLLGQLDASIKAFEEGAKPRGRPAIVALAAALALVLGTAAYFAVQFYPEARDLQQSARAMDELQQRNDQLASELNKTLLRLQSAKETELALDRMRTLAAQLETAEQRAIELEREAPANLARVTQLQSDLDLTRNRLQRLSTEMASRDLRILELERLLGEVGSETMQISPPPPLSLSSPGLTAAILGLPDPLPPEQTNWSDFAADSLRTLQTQAEEAFKARNFALAEVLFQRVADAAPHNYLALSNLAAAQLELEKLALAKANIRAALAIKPDDAFSLTTLGVIQLKTGEADEAVKSLLRSIELEPNAPDSFNYLGVAFDTIGERERAIEEIRKALKISPRYADAHFNLAVLLAAGGASELPLARKHYEEALQLGAAPDPDLDRLLR